MMNIAPIGGFHAYYFDPNTITTQREKTFSEKAYSNQFVQENEVELGPCAI